MPIRTDPVLTRENGHRPCASYRPVAVRRLCALAIGCALPLGPAFAGPAALARAPADSASAQTSASSAPTPSPAAENETASEAARDRSGPKVLRLYRPEDFAQLKPRSALDMIEQLPGFAIVEEGGGNNGQRGLGQASQNVLINGQRITSKSDSVRDRLARIPAGDVVRIEMVDGASLDIPGLSGQVANVVVEGGALSGQFAYRASVRPHNAKPALYGGEFSLRGESGAFSYSLAIENPNRRFGNDGPTTITDGAGVLVEREEARFSGGFDQPRLSAGLGYRPSDAIEANLNASFERSWFFSDTEETGLRVNATERQRELTRRGGGPEYEVNSDLSVKLGATRLKLIALHSSDKGRQTTTLIDRFSDGTSSGSKFSSQRISRETIGRLEYNFPLSGIDWQLALEAAYNRFERASRLFELDANANFAEIDFPEGTGAVTEDRYEAMLSASRALTKSLSLQARLGGESSRLRQRGGAANARRFLRPKGAVALAWLGPGGTDVALELERRVGQLSFGDFLASVDLGAQNQNSANAQLVPEQSWDLSLQVTRPLGALGSVTLNAQRRWISDLVDFLPLEGGGEARGNLPSARLTSLSFKATIKTDRLGLSGGQLDLEAEKIWSRLDDPLTTAPRPFSSLEDLSLSAEWRHDIAQSDWAWGFEARHEHKQPYFREREVGQENEGPLRLDAFVEHKDVFGLTVNASLRNIAGARDRFERTRYLGPRNSADIDFIERSSKRVGLTFRLEIRGDF